MILTNSDYYEMLSSMKSGGGCLEFEKDGELLTFDYDVEVEGYTEDDAQCGYGNGTGAYIVTGADVTISNVYCSNEDNETDNNFNENLLCKMFEDELLSH